MRGDRSFSDPYQWLVGAAFLAILVTTVLVYWPGLSGGFLLDDFARLPKLGNFGGVDSLPSLLYYLDKTWTGLAGRPLAYVSFLIDHNTWPAPAADFKYTNVLLHLVNGCLLFALLQRLLTQHGLTRPQVLGLSLFVTAGWLLHPLLVSTTLYVIQRMALLAATFVLLGLLGYLVAREDLDTRPKRALCVMTVALGLGGGIGLLAKGNAGLIVPLALVLEFTLLPSPRHSQRSYRYWRAVCLEAPTIVLFGYIGVRGLETLDGSGSRDFDGIERLLTQSRVVTQYLSLWFVPQSISPGLYNDDVAISRGLFDPLTTLPCVLFISALTALTLVWRRRFPLAAAGLGFFLAGHLLESTTLPLELYFEHRNYLPTALLWLPVGAALLRLPWPTHRTIVVALALPVVLASLTYLRSNIWGDTALHAAVATQENPQSQRAYRSAAMTLQDERPRKALDILERGHANLPDNLPVLLSLIDLQCRLGEPDKGDVQHLHQLAATYRYWPNAFGAYENMVTVATSGACRGVTPHTMRRFLRAQLSRLESLHRLEGGLPHYDMRVSELHQLLGQLALGIGRPCEASRHFRRASQYAVSATRILELAKVLTDEGLHSEALTLIRVRPDNEPAPSHGLSLQRAAGIQASIKHNLVQYNRRKLEQPETRGRTCALPPLPPQRASAANAQS